MQRDQIRYSARMAGMVKRYHAWPTLQTQTIAEHSWQLCRIYLEIWGHLPREIAEYFVVHDLGEMVSGDLPFPIKAENPVLKVECDRIEAEALKIMLNWGTLPLHNYEKLKVKLCDLLEMYEFGRTEQLLGNRFAGPIIQDTGAVVNQLRQDLHIADREKLDAYVRKMEQLLCL